MLEKIKEKTNIILESFNQSNNILVPKEVIDINGVALSSYQGQLDLLIDDIVSKKKDDYKIVILSGTRA